MVYLHSCLYVICVVIYSPQAPSDRYPPKPQKYGPIARNAIQSSAGKK